MLSTYDTWKTDPDYGKSLYQIELEEDMLAEVMESAEDLRHLRSEIREWSETLYHYVNVLDEDACHAAAGYGWGEFKVTLDAFRKIDVEDTLKDEERLLSDVVL